MNWGDWVAVSALAVSLILALLNRAYTDKKFKQSHYPAVGWFYPETCTDEQCTKVKCKIVNDGPQRIAGVAFNGSFRRGIKNAYWCTFAIDNIPAGETCDLNITEGLENDIQEIFGGLYREGKWHFREKPKSFKVLLSLSYIPFLAGASREKRDLHFALVPPVQDETITGWQFHLQPRWRYTLPF